MRKTITTKPVKETDIVRKWHVIDMAGKILGRMTPTISHLLQGKNKVNYVKYLDSGDYVVVINAAKTVLSGRKAQAKTYDRYSGYPGGLKVDTFDKLIKDNPEAVIRHAVSGMLPKNKTRDARLARLFVYKDDKHPHMDKITK